mgnify:CR=1 FL=1
MAVENSSSEYILRVVASQRDYFRSGATLDLKFRKEMLQRLLDALHKWERPLAEALWCDLHKSYEEAYMTELSIVLGEVKNHLKHLSSWASPKSVANPLKMFPSCSKVLSEPLGNTLIIAPWNYPVQLLLNPLVGAISAGCTAILKPSPYVPNVAQVLEQMIDDTFEENYIAVVQGNRDVNRALLAERFDLIFFTGSPVLGRQVMEAAAKNLTPVVLELGGKSPCIIDKSADLKMAARRIAFGKYLNCGQTCVAPDYILCDETIKNDFLKYLYSEIERQYGKKPLNNYNYGKIINRKHYDRLIGLIDKNKVVYGGKAKEKELRIEPTVMDNVTYDDLVMKEEIFGPILPILTFENIDVVISDLSNKDKPLALYIFSKNKKVIDKITSKISYGGGCVNDVIIHLATSNMGFGGVGSSGMGSYHGKDGFDTFTHYKSIVDKKNWIDLPMRYQPYKELYRLLIKLFLR